MNCPHCSTELKLDGEFYSADVDLVDPSTVQGSVSFTFFCNSCNEALGEYDFAVELDVSSFTDDHVDHELNVELLAERFVRSTITVGFNCIIVVSCSCCKFFDFAYSDSAQQNRVIDTLIDY